MEPTLFSIDIDSVSNADTSTKALELFNLAKQSIRENILDKGFTCVLNSSYGKDSVVTKMAVINAIKEYREETGINPKLIVATALCGGMESPVIYHYVQKQISNLKKYAKDNELNIEVIGVEPEFSENYLVQMISGKTIQSIKGSADCSIDVKQKPIRRMVEKLNDKSYVTCLGTRFSESENRKKGMQERNEAYNKVTEDANGRKTIPPICEMTDDMVFDIIQKASFQQLGISMYEEYECPVDAGAVVELYGIGSEHSCSTAAFLEGVDGDFDIGGSCDDMSLSGRWGCWTCGRCGPIDKKHTQVSKQSGYEYLSHFLRVREALMAAENNLNVRTWLNKKVENGSLTITPGSYSPQYCMRILKWTLTLRAITGFETISDRECLWVMINWIRYGFEDAFEVINVRNEILLGGKRYYPSDEDIRHRKKTKIPNKVEITVIDNEYGAFGHSNIGKGEDDSDLPSNEDAAIIFEEHWDKFGEKEQTTDFSYVNKAAPTVQLCIMKSMLGMYEFSRERASASNRMLQRANLLHRLGLRAHLGNREYLINRFMSVDEFELVA